MIRNKIKYKFCKVCGELKPSSEFEDDPNLPKYVRNDKKKLISFNNACWDCRFKKSNKTIAFNLLNIFN